MNPFGNTSMQMGETFEQGPFGRKVVKPIRGGGQKMNPPTQALEFNSFLRNQSLANDSLPMKKRAFSKAPVLSRMDQKK